MMVMTQDRHTVRLLTASAVLAVLVALELVAGPFFVPEEPEYRDAAETATDVPVLPPRENPNKSDYAEISARPLFSSSRRPQAEAKLDGPVARSDAFDLIGVIIEPQGRTALLQPKPSGKVIRVVVGQNVEGWDVRAIKPTQITLRRDNGEDQIISISQKPRRITGSRVQAIQANSEPAADDESAAEADDAAFGAGAEADTAPANDAAATMTEENAETGGTPSEE